MAPVADRESRPVPRRVDGIYARRQRPVGRGDGKGFVLLTVDTTPNYVDTQPFPAAKTVWSYKAIYRADDAQVGQWSQPVSVAVGG